MNILIIAHHFPPENAMASLRPYSWAKYWSRWGHKVIVLTTQKAGFDAPLTLFSDSSSREFKVEEISYLRKKHQDKLGKSVIEQNYSPKKRIVDPIIQWSRKIRQSAGTGALLSVRSLWIQPALKRAVQLHDEYSFDVVVSTYGPPAPHIVASLLKRRLPSLLWMADYRDLWNDYNDEIRKWPFSVLENFIENYFVAKADMLTTVSDPLGEILAKRFSKPVFTIENGFDVDDIVKEEECSLVKGNLFNSGDKVTLVYTGKIYAGKRDPYPLLKAIHNLNAKGILNEHNFQALFFSDEIGPLPALIARLKIEHLVKVPGFVERPISLAIQRCADALIFLDWSDPNIDGILTGKLFEYLFSGTPILGIGSQENFAAGKLIKESGCGICLGQDVPKITTVLEQLIAKQALPYQPRPEVLQRYTREGLAQKMLQLLQELTGKP